MIVELETNKKTMTQTQNSHTQWQQHQTTFPHINSKFLRYFIVNELDRTDNMQFTILYNVMSVTRLETKH